MFGLTLSPHCGRPRTSKGGALVKVVFSSGQVTLFTEEDREDSSAERNACWKKRNIKCLVFLSGKAVNTVSKLQIQSLYTFLYQKLQKVRNFMTLGPAHC